MHLAYECSWRNEQLWVCKYTLQGTGTHPCPPLLSLFPPIYREEYRSRIRSQSKESLLKRWPLFCFTNCLQSSCPWCWISSQHDSQSRPETPEVTPKHTVLFHPGPLQPNPQKHRGGGGWRYRWYESITLTSLIYRARHRGQVCHYAQILYIIDRYRCIEVKTIDWRLA